MADAEPNAASEISDADKRAIVDRFLKENGELVAQIPGNKTKVKLFAKVVEIEVQLEIARRMAKDQSAEVGDALDQALAASAKQAEEGKEIEAELADAWQETDDLKSRIASLESESAKATDELSQSQALRTKLEEEIGALRDAATLAKEKAQTTQSEFEAALALAEEKTATEAAARSAAETELEEQRGRSESEAIDQSVALEESKNTRAKLEQELGALRDQAVLDREAAEAKISDLEAALSVTQENAAAAADAGAEKLDTTERLLAQVRAQSLADGQAAAEELAKAQQLATDTADLTAKLDAALADHSELSAKLKAASAEAAAQSQRADAAEQRATLAEAEVGDTSQRATELESKLATMQSEIDEARTQAQERVAAETDRANAAELAGESLQENLTAAQAALTKANEESAAQLEKLNERVRGLTLDLAVAKKAGEQAATAAAKEVRQAREQADSLETSKAALQGQYESLRVDAEKSAMDLEQSREQATALATAVRDLEAKLTEVTAERDTVAAKVEAAETEAAAQRTEAERAAQSEKGAVSQRDHALAEADSIAKAFSAYKANDKTPQLLEEIERLKKDLHEASQALQFADLHPTLPFAEIKMALGAGLAAADGPIKQFGEQLQAAVTQAETDLQTVRAKVDGGNGSVEVIVQLGALQARAELLSEHARAFAALVS